MNIRLVITPKTTQCHIVSFLKHSQWLYQRQPKCIVTYLDKNDKRVFRIAGTVSLDDPHHDIQERTLLFFLNKELSTDDYIRCVEGWNAACNNVFFEKDSDICAVGVVNPMVYTQSRRIFHDKYSKGLISKKDLHTFYRVHENLPTHKICFNESMIRL